MDFLLSLGSCPFSFCGRRFLIAMVYRSNGKAGILSRYAAIIPQIYREISTPRTKWYVYGSIFTVISSDSEPCFVPRGMLFYISRTKQPDSVCFRADGSAPSHMPGASPRHAVCSRVSIRFRALFAYAFQHTRIV